MIGSDPNEMDAWMLSERFAMNAKNQINEMDEWMLR
jgi:hypothetical protein